MLVSSNAKRLVVAVAGLAVSATAIAQDTVHTRDIDDGVLLIVKDESGLISPSSPGFFASNINGWNPNDPAYRLQGRSDLRWQVRIDSAEFDQTIEFKFTRGSWATAEVDAELGDIGNRVLEPVSADRVTPGQPTVYEFTIPAFADQRDGAVTFGQDGASLPVEVSAGTLRRLEIAGGGGDAAGSIRELLVWLPEGYFDEANADRRYPVLYLHDGQNLFDTMPGGPEEWGADETAARLIEEGKVEPLIIVGIPHAGAARLSEYLPLPTPELDVAAGGEAYRRFFYSQLVPRVDRAFRTSTRSADRGIGGASMGGLISLYIASRDFNAQIGKVLAESPTLSFSEDPSYWQILFEPTSFAWRQRVLLNMGRFEVDADAAENEANQRVQTAAFELSQAAQPASPGFRYVLDEDGRHNEATWGSRFEQALIELFPAE